MKDEEKLSTKIQQMMLDKADSVINMAYESLVTDRENNKFPLQLFDQYFAPYFFQGVPVPEGADIFETWIGIAGSPLAPVDIIDEDVCVFTIPPLYDTSLINMLSTRGTSQVIDELSLYSNKPPGTYNDFVENKLLPTVDNNLSDKDIIYDKWQAIASRYKVTDTKVANSVNTNHDDDDISYE